MSRTILLWRATNLYPTHVRYTRNTTIMYIHPDILLNNIFRVFEKMRCVLLKLLRITVSAQYVLIVRRVLHAYARSFKL
jgi:hypothetical protein